jgi:phenylacetate-coenzyme A ligase PaaK-like adenylate-forming protein
MLINLLKYYISLYFWDLASINAVKKMQVRKFRKIFEYAGQNSKFYKEFYGDHGVLNLKIESFEDIRKVPITRKTNLRQYPFRDIITCNIDDKINIHSTSGSTGEPFNIAYNKFEDYSSHIRLTKALIDNGYNPFRKGLLLSRYEPGHMFEVEQDIKQIGYLQKKLGLFSYEVISIFEPVEEIIQKLETVKPFIVWSTPSVIEIVALELKKINRKLKIPLVLLMAETISPALIQLIKERIGLNFIDSYGCMEMPCLGYGINQTESKKIFSNSVLVEVINERTLLDEKVGDIVITNLINHTMPFIRFDLGDYVNLMDDKNFPQKKIGRLYGRSEDLINLGDLTIAFHHTYQLFHDFQECEQYKLIQKASGDLFLQLRVCESCNKEEVRKKVLERWGKKYPNLPVTIEWVDHFPINKKTGKFKVIEKL